LGELLVFVKIGGVSDKGDVFLRIFALFLVISSSFSALAADNAALISVSVPTNTVVMPRTILVQTWTVQNTGTTTWTAKQSGYTLNLVSRDSLGIIPLFTNTSSTWYTPSAIIGSGKSIAPGAQAAFSVGFIAPEAAGSVTDVFQLNSASGDYFGPKLSVQVVVEKAGSTNQYDRAKAVSYANNYVGYICSDGYFWTNGSDYYDYGTNEPVPTDLIGDDCAHFVSCCIGRQPNQWGGGIYIPSRVPPTYGEPGAARLVNDVLIAPGYAMEVFSLSEMSPGDLIGWNWEGDTDIQDLDHVTLYLGNGLLASHAASCLDTSATQWYQSSESHWVSHFVHIFDAPTVTVSRLGSKMVLSWGTNWSSYVLQSSTSLSAGATWSNVTTKPGKSGALNKLTNSMPQEALFYRLTLP
jgi:cell wall-associated NlpC family hydrolase